MGKHTELELPGTPVGLPRVSQRRAATSPRSRSVAHCARVASGVLKPDEPDIELAPVNADRVAVDLDPRGSDWFGRRRAIGARQRDRGEDEGEGSGAHGRRQ
jgi:hypothetical protein